MDEIFQFVSSWGLSSVTEPVLMAVLSLGLAGLIYAATQRPKKSWAYRRKWKPRVVEKRLGGDVADPKFQMECIARVEFEPQPLLNKSEYKVLVLLEAVVRECDEGYRVMAQTSMGEILRPRTTPWSGRDGELAFRSINSKRVDFVIVDRKGFPALAVEYQGHGHYRERSFMRDAVKREAFRKAKVAFLEVPAEYSTNVVMNDVRKLLQRSELAAE